jgi:RNA polymerase sigma-70 factor (ECF subfamily)
MTLPKGLRIHGIPTEHLEALAKQISVDGVVVIAQEVKGGTSFERSLTTTLHKRYLTDVVAFVSRRVPSRVIEDVTMEVFIRAFRGLSNFRYECSLRLWLFILARYEIAQWWRQQGPKSLEGRHQSIEMLFSEIASKLPSGIEVADLFSEDGNVDEELLLAEKKQLVCELLELLPPDQREALILQYWDQLSLKEIAVIMGRSVGATSALLFRARSAFYKLGRGLFAEEADC